MTTAARYPPRSWVTWLALAVAVLAEIGYPLVGGRTRAALVVVTVSAGYLASVGHAALTRGTRAAGALVLVTTGGGLLVEALGVATGLPFGPYRYSGDLGPRLFGVPLVIPLAWTWMAWPAWLVAGRLVAGWPGAAATSARLRPATVALVSRVLLAGYALAAWDLFLDPQMVREGYWHWDLPRPALPGVPAVPVGNHLGWLVVGVVLMALLAVTGGEPVRGGPVRRDPVRGDPASPARGGDGPMLALYLWTFASSLLAHAVLLGLPGSAVWGGVAMGSVAVPLLVRLWRERPGRAPTGPRPQSGPAPAGTPTRAGADPADAAGTPAGVRPDPTRSRRAAGRPGAYR